MQRFFHNVSNGKELVDQSARALRYGEREQEIDYGEGARLLELTSPIFLEGGISILGRRIEDGATVVIDVPYPLSERSLASAHVTTF